MSASAKIDKLVEDLNDIDVDLEQDVYDGSVMVGGYVNGNMYLVVHECPFCRASMETIGVGHGKYMCSYCKVSRNCEVEMNTTFTQMEIVG